MGDGQIDHRYDVAMVTSMLSVRVQVKVPGLWLGFSVTKGLCRIYGYGQN